MSSPVPPAHVLPSSSTFGLFKPISPVSDDCLLAAAPRLVDSSVPTMTAVSQHQSSFGTTTSLEDILADDSQCFDLLVNLFYEDPPTPAVVLEREQMQSSPTGDAVVVRDNPAMRYNYLDNIRQHQQQSQVYQELYVHSDEHFSSSSVMVEQQEALPVNIIDFLGA